MKSEEIDKSEEVNLKLFTINLILFKNLEMSWYANAD